MKQIGHLTRTCRWRLDDGAIQERIPVFEGGIRPHSSYRGRSAAGMTWKTKDGRTEESSMDAIDRILKALCKGTLVLQGVYIFGRWTYTKQGDAISLVPLEEPWVPNDDYPDYRRERDRLRVDLAEPYVTALRAALDSQAASSDQLWAKLWQQAEDVADSAALQAASDHVGRYADQVTLFPDEDLAAAAAAPARRLHRLFAWHLAHGDNPNGLPRIEDVTAVAKVYRCVYPEVLRDVTPEPDPGLVCVEIGIVWKTTKEAT